MQAEECNYPAPVPSSDLTSLPPVCHKLFVGDNNPVYWRVLSDRQTHVLVSAYLHCTPQWETKWTLIYFDMLIFPAGAAGKILEYVRTPEVPAPSL